jgi:hypothetical protein
MLRGGAVETTLGLTSARRMGNMGAIKPFKKTCNQETTLSAGKLQYCSHSMKIPPVRA